MFATGADDSVGVTVTMAGILVACAGIVTLGSAGLLLWKFFGGPIFKLIGRTNHFLDDWFGTPARDGVPARPGVMVRLADVEADKVDKVEFLALASEVAKKASSAELLELRVALERHITRTEDVRLHIIDDVPEPREGEG